MPFGGLLTVGILGAVGSVAGGAISAGAAGKAADAQTQAANYAADKQYAAAEDSLAFQKQQYADTTTNQAPYIAEGKVALGQLADGTAPGGQFNQTYNASQVLQDDPGYQFRMDEGMKALQRSSAATGSLGSGGTLKAITQYGQNYASGEYANAQARFVQQQDTRFNRLASLAGVGQTATQAQTSAGNTAASNIANINTSTATQAGNDRMNAANAAASGYVGTANALNGTLSNLGSSATNLLLMSKLLPNG